jgi:hypothetical protein
VQQKIEEFRSYGFSIKTEGEPKGMSIYGKANGILVSIQTRNGLHIRRGNLDYFGLVELVKKLEDLC